MSVEARRRSCPAMAQPMTFRPARSQATRQASSVVLFPVPALPVMHAMSPSPAVRSLTAAACSGMSLCPSCGELLRRSLDGPLGELRPDGGGFLGHPLDRAEHEPFHFEDFLGREIAPRSARGRSFAPGFSARSQGRRASPAPGRRFCSRPAPARRGRSSPCPWASSASIRVRSFSREVRKLLGDFPEGLPKISSLTSSFSSGVSGRGVLMSL